MDFGKTKLVGFLIACIHFSSHAHIVKLSDMQTMAKQSDVVIHGHVGEKKVTMDDLGRLVTLTDVEVLDGLHGAKTGEIITIYQVGGQKDGLVMPLLGGQLYHEGQELFFFGLKMGDAFVSYGAGQGKFDIVHDRGEELVREDLGNVSVIKNFSSLQPENPSPLTFESKSILKDEIKEMLKAK